MDDTGKADAAGEAPARADGLKSGKPALSAWKDNAGKTLVQLDFSAALRSIKLGPSGAKPAPPRIARSGGVNAKRRSIATDRLAV
jgi:hypothetical protein